MTRREEIGAIGERVREVFDEKHRAREVTINASRHAIQACASSIRATHRGEYDTAEALAHEARDHVATADHALVGHPDVRTN
ncbi:MAG TPA: haloacid dehalogenase, partial [Acidimicrobiia bacterium]|nr:haloacid dehalogenase [Acidimicrobiia bacterium]